MVKHILEIGSIGEVLPHLDEKTHLFLDVDNTLFTSISEFGSEPWERFMIQHFIREGVPEKEAANRASKIWKAVQIVSEIQFVEPMTQKVVQEMQKLNIPIFAITARDPEFQAVTEAQLASLGLKFSECKSPFNLEGAHYANGVFYCSDVPKGKVLKWYSELQPRSRIVMVDDYRSHLETAVELLDIPFTGLRYGFLDSRKSNYSPCEATKLLGKVFTHRDASRFLRIGIEK